MDRRGRDLLPLHTLVRIELSGDDGRTWKKATVKPTGDNRWDAVAELDPDTKFVSVRGEVSDSDGNKHTQRVIRAYALGK